MKIVSENHKSLYPLYCGITVDRNNSVKFNWDKDTSEDILKLSHPDSGTGTLEDIPYFYSYAWKSANPSKVKLVRSYLKRLGDSDSLYSRDVENFVELGVIQFGNNYDLSKFDVLVYLESTHAPSLIDVMNGYISEYANKPIDSFTLVKNMYRDVQFDEDKARKALSDNGYKSDQIEREVRFLVNKFDSLKQSGELFQMKRFTPRCIRTAFSNFLKFKTSEQRQMYSQLQNANVLVYDDFITSGSTVKEILRYLKSINPNNTLTVFVLVKQ